LLARLGFNVRATAAWPEDDADVMPYQVVLVRIDDVAKAPLVAMRIRMKPHFGRRVLIALVPSGTDVADRRVAQSAGFDDVVSEDTEPRLLAARLMRMLRQRPEYRCFLPRKKAA
jgi:DNA-binding response OmpR family regulator